jgi:hypothetical protein
VAELGKLEGPNQHHLDLLRSGLYQGINYPQELRDKFPGTPGNEDDPPLPQYGFLNAHEAFAWSERKDLVTVRPPRDIDELENAIANFIFRGYDKLFEPLYKASSFFILD